MFYTDGYFVQFFNIMLRKCMEGLDLQLLGRNYFDPKACVKLDEWKLELWPGYVTSIRQHEKEVRLFIFYIFRSSNWSAFFFH